MKRRGLTVLVGAILVVMLTWLVGTVSVPYVELRPGPTFNTLGKLDNGKEVIEVNDRDGLDLGRAAAIRDRERGRPAEPARRACAAGGRTTTR
jgi:PDZ domain-containing secreted protein